MRRVRANSPADGKLREGDALVELGGINVWKSKRDAVSKKLVGKAVIMPPPHFSSVSGP